MQEEFGEDLAIVFVEVQGHKREDVERFTLQKKWFGGASMWTTERPFNTGATGIPNCALLSREGKLLMTGNPLGMHKEIHEAVTSEIRASREAPEGTPRELSKAWKSFGRDKVADAIEQAEKASQDEDSAVAEVAKAALETFQRRLDGRIARATWLLDNGYYAESSDLMKALQKSAKGVPTAEERLDALEERLKSKDLADEISAEKKYLRLEGTLFQNGPEDGLVRALTKFAEQNEGTKAADRARRWITLSKP